MIVNGRALIRAAPIRNMELKKIPGPGGVTYGLGEAGYDIRIKQTVLFKPPSVEDPHPQQPFGTVATKEKDSDGMTWGKWNHGRFIIASAIEEFQMPRDLVGIVHDKSSWARRGLSVFNTIIEPGWKGFLTLELVYHGQEILTIPAGSGIAQVMFHRTEELAEYEGRYQNQADKPVEAIPT